jgi:NAD(P)-dependent dehydrogenase (short-subunit alcohol dehydrogenase family)
MTRFSGKTAIVTGAATGIGRAVAVRLASEGAHVTVAHKPGQDPTQTLDAVAAAGGRATAYAADMRDPVAVRAMVDAVAAGPGGIDVAVSNAAVNPMLPWDELTDEIWDEIHETNLRGCWALSHQAAKHMVTQGRGGAIVAVSSISARVGAVEQVAYCPSKAGVANLMMSLACVLGQYGIRCNSVLPGAIETPMSADMLAAGGPVLDYYLERIALQRIGQPDEIAAAVAFLASDDARYVTSAELLVDGGFIANAEK